MALNITNTMYLAGMNVKIHHNKSRYRQKTIQNDCQIIKKHVV
jgi:hypothetical protein